MTDIESVCDAIAANIIAGMAGDTIAGRTFSIAPDSINPPTAIVVPAPGEFLIYDDTFGGNGNYDIVVKILNGTQDAPSSQAKLMGYMKRTGATSIRAAILSDPKLGATVSYIEVPAAMNYHNVEWSAQLFLGFELSVRVFE